MGKVFEFVQLTEADKCIEQIIQTLRNCRSTFKQIAHIAPVYQERIDEINKTMGIVDKLEIEHMCEMMDLEMQIVNLKKQIGQ